MPQAIAQTTAIAQTAVRQMPPGAVPPLIMRYSATSVPIMMLAMETDTLSEKELFDYGYAKGRHGSPWHNAPPNLETAEPP